MPRYRTTPCPVYEVTAERVELPHGGTVWDVTDSEGNTVRYGSVAFGMTFEPVPDDAPADAPPANYEPAWRLAQWLVSIDPQTLANGLRQPYGWHMLVSEFIAADTASHTATQAER